MKAIETKPIGNMVAKDQGCVVVCYDCEPVPERVVPVFPINILPYNQHCDRCGKVLVTGISSWPELFDGRNDS